MEIAMSDVSLAALEAAGKSQQSNATDILAMFAAPKKPRQQREPVERFAFKVADACEALGIGRTSLYELAKRGDIKLLKIAGRTVVPRSEMERLTRVEREAA